MQEAVTQWVDGIATARGVLSEIHDLLVVSETGHKPTTAPPPTATLSNSSVALKRTDVHQAPLNANNAENDVSPACNLSWLECLSKKLNPFVQPYQSDFRLARRELCRQQPYFTFETLGFLHNQV